MRAKTVLLVDDEVNVLFSLSRTLSEIEFDDVKIAENGMDALDIIKNTPGLAVIVSDYRMPGMNGIELLADTRKNFPDVTRILLTGAADLEMALDAINRGNIFRFLIKPCSPEIFLVALKDGLRQNELITSERELLSKTLNGSLKVMIDILAVLSPGIFAQAGRLRSYAHDLSGILHLEETSWEIELAALLSQIGAVTIPRDILERWQGGELLQEAEVKIVRSVPNTGKLLIKNIPRLENVAEAVGYQDCTFRGKRRIDAPTGGDIPLMARVLKVIVDYDRLVEKSHNPMVAFQAMIVHESDYDPGILAVFRSEVLHLDVESSYELTSALKGEKEVTINDLKLGMIISRDILDRNGILIISKDTVVTEVLKYRLMNYFHSLAISETVFIESTYIY